MAEKDFSIGGKHFKLSKLDAFKQFHIVRRVGPILSDLIPALQGLKNATDRNDLDALAKIATPVMSGLSKLSDLESEMVLFGLLSSVEIQQSSGNWAKVSSGSMLMIQDLTLPILLQLAGRAFAYNLQDFFLELPQK